MEFIIILLLLILNGIFAMYEIALVSSSKARLETLVGKGNKRAKGVLKQLEEPEKFLSTIQIGITLIGIVSGAYGGATIADDVEPLFALIPGVAAYAKTLAMITVVSVAHHRRTGAQVHRLEQPGTMGHHAQPLHDCADQDFLSVCMPAERFHQTDEQTHRTEQRRRTPNDTRRTEDDSAPKLGTRRHRQRRNGNVA